MNQACVAASEFRSERDALAARVARLEKALRFQDPRNASERYERIADDFEKETGHPAPGRDMAAARGGLSWQEEKDRNEKWRPFVNAWHERWFDAALAHPSGDGVKADG
jgi:hypothetical protein